MTCSNEETKIGRDDSGPVESGKDREDFKITMFSDDRKSDHPTKVRSRHSRKSQGQTQKPLPNPDWFTRELTQKF